MIKDKIFAFFIIIIIFSFLLLSYFSYFFKPAEINLFDYDQNKLIDKSISITGLIKNTDYKKDILFFEVCQYSRCLDVILFNPTSYQLDYIQDKSIDKTNLTIIGQFTIYNNKPEVIVSRLV